MRREQPSGYPGTDSKRRMRRDFGRRAALTTHQYTESDDFKPQKALLAAEFAMPQNNLPGTARGARLCVSVADVLREDFDGVEAAVSDIRQHRPPC